MTLLEYIQSLTEEKNKAVARWEGLTPVEKALIDNSHAWLIENLTITRGTPEITEDLAGQMDRFVKAVVEIIKNSKGFRSRLSLFLSDLQQIHANTERFHMTTNRLNIKTAGVTSIQKAVVGEIIDQYLDNGLNAHFAQPLRQNIFRNILLGANMREIKQVLQAHIISGKDKSGKLHRYLTQTAQQAVDSYTGAINQQLKKEFTFTGYLISGSLIETSSKQCVYAVENSREGYFTFNEWEKVLDMARNNERAKLIEGTTIDTLPLNKLHWGCRHDFTPIIKKEKK